MRHECQVYSIRSNQVIGVVLRNLHWVAFTNVPGNIVFMQFQNLHLGTSCLSDLDDIIVRITHVAANLHAVVLWLGKEFGPSPSPLIVQGPDVRDTNIQEAGNLIGALRGTKRHGGSIVRWAATDV